ITSYEYSTDGGVTWRLRAAGSTTSPLTILTTSATGAPLVNGRLSTVQIRALNVAGSGAASASTIVAPLGAPDAPTGVTVTSADRALVVAFTSGGDGGAAVTRFEYRLDGGTWTDTGSLTSPFTIGGLTNGVGHSVEVRAVSALGAGDSSVPVSGTPRTAPDAPTAVAAAGGDGTATVTWSAPASDGASAISGYTVTLYDAPTGGLAAGSCTSGGALTCTVAGLRNGTTYHAAVVATNAAGTGPASAPRVEVRPVGRPSVAISGIVPGATSLTVDVATDDSGAPMSAYEYRLDGGPWTSTGTTTEPFTISGLRTGQTYSVEVRGRNDLGAGDPSAPLSATPRTLPGAPVALGAASGSGSAALTWTAPADNGGAAVSDYVVQYATNVAGPFTTFADGTSPTAAVTVTGLTDGTGYLFRVAAINAAGTGPWSGLASTTPLSAPAAPNLSALTVGSQFMQAAFTAPVSNGGSAITGYQYQLDGGEWRNATGTTSPLLIPGLTNGHSYSVAVRAVNAVGGGTASNIRSATPYGLPSAVDGFVASPGSGSVTLTWDAANANGSPITGYNVVRWSAASEGSIVSNFTTTSTSATVTGLSAGTYWFTIEASNAAGTGPRSAPRTSATVGATTPAAPTIGVVSVSGTTATLSWTNGAAGTAPIDGAVIRYVDGVTTRTVGRLSTAATSATVTLPSAAAAYSLQVASLSSAGVGAFSTIRPSLVGAASASDVGSTGATVSGTANANGATADVVVEYATDAGLLGTASASSVAVTPATVTGSTDTSVAGTLSGLEAGTTYVARLRATSGTATTVGASTTFTTPAGIHSSGLTKVYDGGPIAPVTVTSPGGLGVTRTFVGTGGTHLSATSVAPSTVGTYQMTTTIDGGALSGSEVVAVEITARPLTMAVSAVDRAWDGTTAVDLVVALTGAVTGDDVGVAPGALTGSLPSAGAGDRRAVAIGTHGVVLVGADAANYSVSVPSSSTVDIARAAQAVRFTTTAPESFVVGQHYRPAVTSDQSLAVALDLIGTGSDPAACRFVDGDLIAVAPGSCTLVATQPGTPDVAAAAVVGQVVVVRAADVPTTTAAPTTAAPTGTTPGSDADRGIGTRLPSSGGQVGGMPIGSFGRSDLSEPAGSEQSSTGAPAAAESAPAAPDAAADPAPAEDDSVNVSPAPGGVAASRHELGDEVAASGGRGSHRSDPITSMASVAVRHPVVAGSAVGVLLIGLGWLLLAWRRRRDEDVAAE
ncbi:MAG: fibronectin type III domain-containing protein, partial [Actinobacteria bacterium]|nr:fibronectin type III domain-containing protein [Actinomycetota bacterium]